MLTVRCPKHPDYIGQMPKQVPCDVCEQLRQVIANNQLEAASMGYLYGPQLTPRCKFHPRYTGQAQKPNNGRNCEDCWELYDLAHEPDFAI